MASTNTDNAKIVRKFAQDKGFFVRDKGVLPNWAFELYQYGNKEGITQEDINSFMKVRHELPCTIFSLHLLTSFLFLL